MTSKAQHIYNTLLKEHPEAVCTITKLSLNDSGDRNFVISDEVGFNYDCVTNCSASYSFRHKEKSPDALFCVDDKLYFVEFKEGKQDKGDIRMKIHEGITTLYMFVKQYAPEVSREDFFNLDINYAVIIRSDPRHINSPFKAILKSMSDKYSLKNIEGFIINQTRVTADPEQIVQFLHKVTERKLTCIEIFEHLGKAGNSIFQAKVQPAPATTATA